MRFKMEIFTLLETLEDILEKSKSLPFTAKAVVDKEEMLDIIKEIRLKLPDELTFYIVPQYLYDDFDIHICKISDGWVPSFEVNDNFTTYKEFKKFYLDHKDEFLLIDEYNKEIDLATLDSNLEYHKLTALDKNKRTSNFYAKLYTDEDGYDWIDCNFA